MTNKGFPPLNGAKDRQREIFGHLEPDLRLPEELSLAKRVLNPPVHDRGMTPKRRIWRCVSQDSPTAEVAERSKVTAHRSLGSLAR